MGKQLERDKVVTTVSLGNLIVSLFLALLTEPCLTWCFKDVEALLFSSRHCLAALALSKITSKRRDLEVEPEVEGRVSGDNWVKAGSLGNMGRPSCECLQT